MKRKRKNTESSILWEDDTAAQMGRAVRRAARRKARKPVNLARRLAITIVSVLLGLALMAAPLATNYLEYKEYDEAVRGQEQAVADESEEALLETLDLSYQYNEQLVAGRTPSVEAYDSLLDFGGNGIMALLRIPKLATVLPIYHSTVPVEDVHGVSQVGPDGQSKGSSLPVGGPSTHCLISNVNSLPSSKQFMMLSELSPGDRLSIIVCGEELAYEVTDSKTATVKEASSSTITQGEDRITLILAEQGNEDSRYVVSAKRSVVSNSLYLGSYSTDGFWDMFSIVLGNMSLPQAIMFVAGASIILFFLGRSAMQLNDRAPKEIGRLAGDSG